jgi:transcription antitermination factor NusG
MSRGNLSAGHARNLFATLQRVGAWADEAPRDPGPWRLIACNVRQELTADIWLRRFGGEVYLPLTWKPVKRSGRQRAPLFPGYLFARIGLLTRDVKDIQGVRGTVVLGNCYIVPEAEIAKIRGAEVNGVIEIKKLKPRAKCQIGNSIKVTDGAFCGYPAVISQITKVKVDGSHRVKAEVNIFGSPTPMWLEHDQFEVVALKDQPVRA